MAPRLRELSDSAWDQALAAFPRATAFHTSRWLRATAPGLGYDLSLQALVEDGRVVGLAPLATRRRGPFSLMGFLPYPYVGPLASPGRLAPLLRAMRRPGTVTSRIEFPPGADVDSVALALAGYRVIDDTTMVVPLAGRSEDDLWAALDAECRTAVRRAAKGGVEVVQADEDMVCRLMPAMQREAYTRNGARPPYDERVLRAIWEAYGGTDDARFSAAVRDDRVLGVQVMILRGDTGFGWGSATRPERGVSPSTALYWAELRWCIERGVARADLVGTPTPGVARFKRQFGAIPERYVVGQAQSPAYRALSAVRGLVADRRAARAQPA